MQMMLQNPSMIQIGIYSEVISYPINIGIISLDNNCSAETKQLKTYDKDIILCESKDKSSHLQFHAFYQYLVCPDGQTSPERFSMGYNKL